MNSPLRILQANSLFQGGGADNQTIDLCCGLRGLGDDVMLAVPEGRCTFAIETDAVLMREASSSQNL